MNIEIIATGEELLDGRVTNSNLTDIANALLPHGFHIQRCVIVGDEPTRLYEAFETAKSRADIVITTGGLGPTDDDRTAALLAQLAGVPLLRNQAVLERLEQIFKKWKRPMADANKKQADIPEGAEILDNAKGTAPGIALRIDNCQFFSLPGVPREMRYLMTEHVIPKMRELRGDNAPQPMLYTYKCFGAGESQFAEQLKELYPLEDGVDIGYRARFPEVHIRLSVSRPTQRENEATMTALKQAVSKKLSQYIYAEDNTSFAGSLGSALLAHKQTMAMAESCTGGMVGQLMTADAGSSAYFLASMVTYSNQAKERILGVSSELLDQHGAVSEPVAIAMAQGARNVGQADIAGAITGIAGPSGGTEEKPVGTVHIAVASATETHHHRFQFAGGRERIRKLSAYAAMQMLRNLLEGKEVFPITLKK